MTLLHSVTTWPYKAESVICREGDWIGNIHQNPNCSPELLAPLSEMHPSWTLTSVGEE